MADDFTTRFYTSLPLPLRSYLERIGAELINPRKAIIKRHFGAYYKEVTSIKFGRDGKIICDSADHLPTEAEAALIKPSLENFNFPATVQAPSIESLLIQHPYLEGFTLYQFYDQRDGSVIMVHQRMPLPDGNKAYVPWVMLDNGQWVRMEPDTGLPFFKPKQPAPGKKIMIHEGAKAATAAQAIANNPQSPHPWQKELSQYEHWGLVGGALAPHRANWSELRAAKPPMVVYVCDHDAAGEGVLQHVSRLWGGPLRGITFSDKFPASWDMADSIPTSMYHHGRYQGPTLKDLMEPATWATQQIEPEEGKKGPRAHVVTSHFVDEWLFCTQPNVFIHRDWPAQMMMAENFNLKVRPFSNVENTGKLLAQHNRAKNVALKYNPSLPEGVYELPGGGGRIINTHVKSEIKPEQGNAAPWLEFITHLIPNPVEREEVVRWCATLIERPGIRMTYGLLLISETQGIGKGTLGEKILAPLVGHHNVSYPSESSICDSPFNEWLSHKRLAVVHEIYAGHSYKAYNKLKSIITDKYVNVNVKFVQNYEIENWVHIFACSNSINALKISVDDRRWFVPKLNELKKPASFWTSFNDWLLYEGGLSIIKWWLQDWLKNNQPVLQGADAPFSTTKQEMIEEAYSPGQLLISQTLGALKEQANGHGVFTTDSLLRERIIQQIYKGQFNDKLERLATCRRVAIDQGWFVGKTKIQVKAWGTNNVNGRVIASTPELASMTPGELADKGLNPYDVTKML